MKVLATEQKLSNAEVLHWLQQTRARHAREDKAAGRDPPQRPKNFLDALQKHERHLISSAYPYTRNPSAYSGTNQDKSLREFYDKYFAAIHQPVFEKWKAAVQAGEVEKMKAGEEMEKAQVKKELSEEELLMVHNLAPKTVEMLQPMLEGAEERFTVEELQTIVDVVKEVYRKDEMAAAGKVEASSER